MADNRPMRRNRDGLPSQQYTLKDGRGHEFQNDQPHDLPLHALAQTPRNVFAKAARIYADNGQTPNASGDSSQVTSNPGGRQAGSASLYALQRKANFTQLILPYTLATVLVLPATSRIYLLIQNLDAAANMFLGFGFKPDGAGGLGLKIIPGGYYEPFQVPQNDVFIAGSGVGNACVIFSNG